MRLVQLKITNFRCFKDQTTISFDDLTVIVGKNDAGKSSLFDALNIFFEGKPTPDKDDLCVHSDDSTVRIVCVFDCIPSQLVLDAQRPTTLSKEHLLNAEGDLEIVKTFNCSLAKPKLVGVFAHASHPTADSYSDLLSLTNARLKQRADSLGVNLENVNQTVNTDLRAAIWGHASELGCQLCDVELKAEAAKAVWDQLKKHLPVFALFKSDRSSTDQDAEAQDPMKAAVKEALKAQEETLRSIAEKVKKEVQEIADRTVDKIREMNPKLASQLTPRVTNKNWDTLFSVSLTGDEDIPLNKRGSGTRRLVLLNFFRAKAEKDAQDKDTGIIYAIEEPETSQHPHNQLMLIKAFNDLADAPGYQVFLTTHTPMLARRFEQHTLRYLDDANGKPTIRYGSDKDTLKDIVTSLGVLPDHNVKAFVGLEGRNDIRFLRHISRTIHDADANLPDLGCAEDNGHLIFVPLGGSSLDLWVSRLAKLNRPEFYIVDRDTTPPDDPHYGEKVDKWNERDGCEAWNTEKRELENYIHPDIIRSEYPLYAGTGNDFEDVPLLFAQAVHEASNSSKTWDDVVSDSELLKKKVSRGKRRLNDEFASKLTADQINDRDSANEFSTWLRAIGSALTHD